MWRQENGIVTAVSLSRDATKIAFQTSEGGGPWGREIYVLTLGEDEAQQVTEFGVDARATTPAWSPDGSQLAYGVRTRLAEASLFLAGSRGTGAVPFLDARAHSYEYPSWSLDGRFLAVRHFEATWGLWTVDVRTGETTPLTYGLSLHFPAWSPEGGRLVYTYASDLHMIDPHTGEHIRQITHDVDDVFERWPVWVDAWHIAFLPFDYADGDADRDIRVIDLTGKERERLTLVDRGVHVEAFSWVDPSRDVSAKGMDASVWADLKHGAVEANVTAGRVR